MRNKNYLYSWILGVMSGAALILCMGAVHTENAQTTEAAAIATVVADVPAVSENEAAAETDDEAPVENDVLTQAAALIADSLLAETDAPDAEDEDAAAIRRPAVAPVAQDRATTRPLEIAPELRLPDDDARALGDAGGEGSRFNFRNAPLYAVMDYLSKEYGFIVLGDTAMNERVNLVVSHQPASREEVVNLLNTILYEKGYAAIWSGRTLRIVSKERAAAMNIPVRIGKEAEKIPATDEMVTQVIPVRYASVAQLVRNIDPLLPQEAVISANEGSNAIILTGNQSNIRRMVEIIQALDTSLSEIATLRVFVLRYTDAVETARIVNDLFEVRGAGGRSTGRGGGGGNDPRAEFIARIVGQGGGAEGRTGGDSAARQAASRVIAVSDQYTNAVIVRGPEELMPAIEKLIAEIDVVTVPITEVHVFPLQYAGAEETAAIIRQVFQQSGRYGSSQRGDRQGGFSGMFGGGTTSQRQAQANAVVVTPDTRTNSLIVSAVGDVMDQVEMVIRQLDANPAKEQNIQVYSLKNANPETVATFLRQMVNDQRSRGTGTSSRTSSGTSGFQPASGFSRGGTSTGGGTSGASGASSRFGGSSTGSTTGRTSGTSRR